MGNWLQELWCKKMHTQAMWPIHGKYICPTCLREYPVEWEGPATSAEYADPSLRGAAYPLPTAVFAGSVSEASR